MKQYLNPTLQQDQMKTWHSKEKGRKTSHDYRHGTQLTTTVTFA